MCVCVCAKVSGSDDNDYNGNIDDDDGRTVTTETVCDDATVNWTESYVCVFHLFTYFFFCSFQNDKNKMKFYLENRKRRCSVAALISSFFVEILCVLFYFFYIFFCSSSPFDDALST